MPRNSIPLLVVTALAAAGCTGTPVVEETPSLVSRAVDVYLPADVRTISARVLPGSTLASLLRAHQVAEAEVAALVARASTVFDLRRVRVHQPYRLAQAIDGALRWFEYEIDGDRLLKVARSAGEPEFVAEVLPIAKTARTVTVRGTIDEDASSLFAAMDEAGEEVDLSLALAAIFASDVDFNTELQPGDRFELVVEKLFREEDDAFGGYGPILAAELHNDGRQLRAIRFAPEGGSPGYFDEDGRSLRKFFLRSPLKFDPVITSGFSRRRLHPVLRQYRAHNGVDYRAPTGAPVVAVASGAVTFAGANGGAGRMVRLRHANGFESEYLHLSSIAVRRGARVDQGQVIGRVGSTGLATGPHLHYQLRRNGALVNPVTAHRAMPPGDPIPASDLPRFAEQRDRLFAGFAQSAVVAATH